jgi:hypothetical protein
MAATALRRLAVERAAARLGRAVEALRLGDDGTILGGDTAPLGLADLVAGDAGQLTGPITPADAPDWGLAGLGVPERRHDLEAKLTGPAFLHDLDLPDMVHAKLVLPPSVHATLVSTDIDAVRAIDGVVEVVHDGRLLMVIAERESVALRAAAALEARTRWEDPGLGLSAGVLETMRGLPSKPHVTRQDEGVDDALAQGTRVVATYTRPYQSHGSMSPSAGVAWLQAGHLEVWSHTQGVFQVHGGFGVGADDQHFELFQHLQRVDQPLDARVELPPALLVIHIRLRLVADFGIQVSMLAQRQLHVLVGAGQRVGVQFAIGKALDRCAGVAEQQTAGAMAVEQFTHQARRGFAVASIDGGQ